MTKQRVTSARRNNVDISVSINHRHATQFILCTFHNQKTTPLSLREQNCSISSADFECLFQSIWGLSAGFFKNSITVMLLTRVWRWRAVLVKCCYDMRLLLCTMSCRAVCVVYTVMPCCAVCLCVNMSLTFIITLIIFHVHFYHTFSRRPLSLFYLRSLIKSERRSQSDFIFYLWTFVATHRHSRETT